MRLEAFEFSPHGETLMAVVVGALLATFSGILATQIEAHFKRRERGRDAALMFGELLSTIRILLNLAATSRGRGDPYGPVTLRLLRAVRREIDIYDRNRERLYDLRVAKLRVTIHTLIVRLAMPLDGILDAASELASRPDDPALAAARQARVQGFDFLVETEALIPAVLADLGVIAHHSFSSTLPTDGAAAAAQSEAP